MYSDFRPLGGCFGARTRKWRATSFNTVSFSGEECLDVRILVDNGCAILSKATRVRGRTVGAVEVVAQGAQVSGELTPMMRRMSNSANDNPGAASSDIEECCFFFEPGFRHCTKCFQAQCRSDGIFSQELAADLSGRQRRFGHIDAEELLHPGILTNALMNHLLQNAAGAALRPPGHLRDPGHGPHAQDLLTLRSVRVREERITTHEFRTSLISASMFWSGSRKKAIQRS